MSIREEDFSVRFPVDWDAVAKIKGYLERNGGKLDKRIYDLIYRYDVNIFSQIQQEIPKTEEEKKRHRYMSQPADRLRPFSLSPERIIAEVLESLALNQRERIQRIAEDFIFKVFQPIESATSSPAFERMVSDFHENIIAIAFDPIPSQELSLCASTRERRHTRQPFNRVAPAPQPHEGGMLPTETLPRVPTPMVLDGEVTSSCSSPSMNSLLARLLQAKMKEDNDEVRRLIDTIMAQPMTHEDQQKFLEILGLVEKVERKTTPLSFDLAPPDRVRYVGDVVLSAHDKENRAPGLATEAPSVSGSLCAASSATHTDDDDFKKLIDRAQQAYDSGNYEEMQRVQIEFQKNPLWAQCASERRISIFFDIEGMLQAIQASLQQS